MASPTDPALKPPAGTVSNFDDPPSLQYYASVTVAVCISTVTVIFLLRCYARIRYKKKWNAEDWLILLAWIGTVAFMVMLAISMPRAGGKHLWDTTKGEAREFAYWFHVTTCEYAAAICTTKVAILWLYRSAFAPRKGCAFEIACFVLIGVNVVYYAATLLAKIFACTPTDKIYDSDIPGTCVSIYDIMVSDGVFNIVTDFIILLMPAVTLYRLRMAWGKKLVVLSIFTLGLCAPIFSVIGFYVRLQHGQDPDVTWNLPPIVFWGGAEITIGTVCVCLPELGALFNFTRRARRTATSPTHIRKASGGNSPDAFFPRADPGLARRPTLVDAENAHVNPYISVNEAEAGMAPPKVSVASHAAEPHASEPPTEDRLPLNAVYVRRDFRIHHSPTPDEPPPAYTPRRPRGPSGGGASTQHSERTKW